MRRLHRSRANLMIGGVCGGLGEYFAIDPTLVRLFFVLLVLAGGSGILLYLLFWLIMPLPDGGAADRAGEIPGESAPAPAGETAARPGLILGIVLVVLGALFLLWNLGQAWFPWWTDRLWFLFHGLRSLLHRGFWPLLLILLGVFLATRRAKGE